LCVTRRGEGAENGASREAVVLSVEIIEHLRQEEERRRREKEAAVVRIPVEAPREERNPDGENAGALQPAVGSQVLVVDLSQDDVGQFKVATW
jgi:hypothetical protein